MEERLDDAINVLRNHAESQALSLAGVQHSASGIVPLYHQHLVSLIIFNTFFISFYLAFTDFIVIL